LAAGSGAAQGQVIARQRPNKRLKLPAPAFKGSGRLCTSEPIPQGGALAPASLSPAA